MKLKCAIGMHEWDGCKCPKCSRTRGEGHDWTADCEMCAKCGKTREKEHHWAADCEKCAKCGKTRTSAHSWIGCKCSKCGIEMHDWDGCKCSKCGISKFLITLGDPAAAIARQAGLQSAGPFGFAVLLPRPRVTLGGQIRVVGTIDGSLFHTECYTEGQSPLMIETEETATGEVMVTKIGAVGRKANINGSMSSMVILYVVRGQTPPIITITDIIG